MSAWKLLDHLSGIALRGPDAAAFAHAQFTTGFEPAPPEGWRLTAWCNPKGRVLSVILARAHERGVDLIVPAVQGPNLIRQLGMYGIGRKVVITEVANVEGCVSAHAGPGMVLTLDPDRALRLVDDPSADQAADPDFVLRWRRRDLTVGLPWLGSENSGQFLPQSLGLEERDGLSYTKGCYPGQEVVARVHYLGKVKERLSGFRLQGSSVCKGQQLLAGPDQVIGTVLDDLSADDETIGLAVIRADTSAGAEVRCLESTGVLCDPEQLAS